jgi:hypothetical protein
MRVLTDLVVRYEALHVPMGAGQPIETLPPSQRTTPAIEWDEIVGEYDETDATIAGFQVQKDGPVSLSKCRPMRAVANRQPDAVL